MSVSSSSPAATERSVVFKYYGFQLFFSLLIWLPVFYEYQIRIGLTPAQIFSIQSIYYLAFCLLEIPTGVIADRLGYQKCMVWGGITLVGANLFAIFMQDFTGLTIHFLLIALSRSLISGSSSAYIYDYLAGRGKTDEYKKIEGRARAYGLVAKVICWVGVGSLLNYHLTLPYWVTVLAAFISVIFAWALPSITELGSKKVPILPNLANAFRTVWSTQLLFLVILQGIGLFVLARIVQVNLFQPILNSKHFAVTQFGWIMSLMTIFEAIGSFYPGLMRRFSGNLGAVFTLTLVMALSLAFIPVSAQLATLACLCVFSLVAGLSFPIQKQLMNDLIPPQGYRATILSIESIIDRAICAVVAALLGTTLSGGVESLNRFLFISAATTAVGIALLYFFMNRQRASGQGTLQP